MSKRGKTRRYSINYETVLGIKKRRRKRITFVGLHQDTEIEKNGINRK